jgi:hypothetical protein
MMQQTVKAMSRTTLLHCKRDRSFLSNAAGIARDGNDVRTWGSARVPSTSTTITASTATESNDGEKQYDHSEDFPPSPPPGRNPNEHDDARESCAAHPRPEKPPAPVYSGGRCRCVHSKRSCLRCRTADGHRGWNVACRRIACGRRSNCATQTNRASKSARGCQADSGCVPRSRSTSYADCCASDGKTGTGGDDVVSRAGHRALISKNIHYECFQRCRRRYGDRIHVDGRARGRCRAIGCVIDEIGTGDAHSLGCGVCSRRDRKAWSRKTDSCDIHDDLNGL